MLGMACPAPLPWVQAHMCYHSCWLLQVMPEEALQLVVLPMLAMLEADLDEGSQQVSKVPPPSTWHTWSRC